jgi:N-acetylglutamate synthase-like GNAT family acetyltransferase
MESRQIEKPVWSTLLILLDFGAAVINILKNYIYMVTLADISIRTHLQPGDIGMITHLHGKIYSDEYNYGISFELYVAKGLGEFYENFDETKDRVWICEHNDVIIGFLLLMHRPANTAQLRYFLIQNGYRGVGLEKKLMDLYMEFYRKCGYASSYLWTTHELHAAASLYMHYGFRLTEEKDSGDFGKKLKEQRYDLNSSDNT